MEKNQQITDTESAMEDMALQETLKIGEQEQEEIERSLTELQWQQRLNDQLTETDLSQQMIGTGHTENGTEGGGRDHPPTQITKSRNIHRAHRRQ